ncbi:MAG TPA: nuclear transport factor 2 family protein, partial [Bradyrhizobium sp.]|nr:nuclear transport factor 2 family protein [Bradyrhizobium sp.]
MDACKQRRLDDLLNLYDATATVECCEGGSFRGRSEMERYWRPRLARSARGAFEIDVLMPDEDGVTLDYAGTTAFRCGRISGSQARGNQPHRLRAYQSGCLKWLGTRIALVLLGTGRAAPQPVKA